jgi:hypothetical protein
MQSGRCLQTFRRKFYLSVIWVGSSSSETSVSIYKITQRNITKYMNLRRKLGVYSYLFVQDFMIHSLYGYYITLIDNSPYVIF